MSVTLEVSQPVMSGWALALRSFALLLLVLSVRNRVFSPPFPPAARSLVWLLLVRVLSVRNGLFSPPLPPAARSLVWLLLVRVLSVRNGLFSPPLPPTARSLVWLLLVRVLSVATGPPGGMVGIPSSASPVAVTVSG